MRKNKGVALALMASMIGVVGCSSNSVSNSNSPAASAYTGSSSPKAQENITITTARTLGSDYVFMNGEDINNNVHTKWAKEKLGITLKELWDVPTADAYTTKLRLTLTTNDQLPDVFVLTDENLIANLMESGKVKDISADFEKYASERIKKLYADNNSVFNQVKKGNQVLALPLLAGGDSTNPVLWVRQDWLDKLNLKAPKTLDEFEKVMDAFTNNDPDGNGKKDTFGFAVSGKNGYSNWMSDASFIFGASSGKFIPNMWYKGDDGTLKYGSVQPEMKQGLAKLQDWFKKGYLDPELAANDEVKATEAFVQGKAGMVAAPNYSKTWPLGDVKKASPNAKLGVYPLPTGVDGKSARYQGPVNEKRVMMFNKDFKYMDAFFKYLDRIYDFQYETGDFKLGWYENYDYAMVDGKPVYDGKKFPTPVDKLPTPAKYTLFGNSPDIPFKLSTDADYIAKGGEPKTRQQISLAQSGKDDVGVIAKAINFQLKNTNAPSLFNGSPTETMKNKGDSLKTMELEAYTKIIYGKDPLDKFDSFVADWKSKGGDQVTKEVNDWYKSIGGK
ncbi:type 2 periplasmic-binding domain-containing protein [Paenibacillus roseipurpureus]|uniref:ABC transporter substrate-binding protein n=1 Tax=Paenibacillus roseopurpureus TaxID=2918901 RepID=A0AA96RIJ8_9BACL|nr:ABC transporter substrate-binding protein [Paenibacillus sp. MBLB1832]WNR42890.1 ABC transporter substrate-binding protein [Paenibacillus sp. MBLB1832]